MRTITREQFAEMCQEALDNWGWELEDNPATMQRTLRYYAENPQRFPVEDDGLIHISDTFTDEWDWLHEIAVSTDWS